MHTIALAKGAGESATTAEGVESGAGEFLKNMNCDSIWGFLLFKA